MYLIREVLHGVVVTTRGETIKVCPIDAFTNNQSLHKNEHSTTMAEGHCLRMDSAMSKEMIAHKELSHLKWVASSVQLVD